MAEKMMVVTELAMHDHIVYDIYQATGVMNFTRRINSTMIDVQRSFCGRKYL